MSRSTFRVHLTRAAVLHPNVGGLTNHLEGIERDLDAVPQPLCSGRSSRASRGAKAATPATSAVTVLGASRRWLLRLDRGARRGPRWPVMREDTVPCPLMVSAPSWILVGGDRRHRREAGRVVLVAIHVTRLFLPRTWTVHPSLFRETRVPAPIGFVRRGSQTGDPPAGRVRLFPVLVSNGWIVFEGHGSRPGQGDLRCRCRLGGHLRRLYERPTNDTRPWIFDRYLLCTRTRARTPSDLMKLHADLRDPGMIAHRRRVPSPSRGVRGRVDDGHLTEDGSRFQLGRDRCHRDHGGNLNVAVHVSLALFDGRETARRRRSPTTTTLGGRRRHLRLDPERAGPGRAMSDMATGAISSVGTTQAATLSNAPRWLLAGHALFIYRVQRRSGQS